MASVKFGLYTISIHDPAIKGLRTIDNVHDGKSLYDIMRDALKPYLATDFIEPESSGGGRATSFSRITATDEKAIIDGVGDCGTYGSGSKLLDVATFKRTPKTKTQADQAPYFFYFDLSGGYKEGVLLFQVTRARSVKPAIEQIVTSYLKELAPELSVRLKSCVPGDVLKALAQKETLRAIIIEKSDVSSDKVVKGVRTNAPGALRLVFKVKGGGSAWKERLGIASGEGAVVEMGEGLSELDEYDKLLVDVEIGKGRTKRIDLGNFGKPQPFVIPDPNKITIQEDGNPRIDDLFALAVDEVSYIRKAIQGRS